MKICFLSLPSYPTLTNQNMGYAGGAEVEQVHLGRELLSRGHDVCFVTYAYGNKSVKSVDGIKIIQTYPRELSGKFSAFEKYAIIISALRKAKADLYFHESGAVGVLPFFSFFTTGKVAYRIPSDTVVLLESLTGRLSMASSFTQRLEFQCSDVVFAQNRFQKETLLNRFGINSYLIKNGLPLPVASEQKPEHSTVLWVGSISKIKRPELFLELAKALPYARFEMVGGRGSPPELYDDIASAASELPNLKFHGFIPYNKVADFFRRAKIFVSTSRMEGFPNTFIQAWANFVPVVSMTVDPDLIIKKNRLGFVSGSFDKLVSDVDRLLRDDSLRIEFALNSRKYVEREHDIKVVAERYIDVFEDLIK
jgi:glycosyltransferase involved in cell wall biosynthesis